jgi:ABC-type Zn uptake system ZnuABC Zn-binding protein ZnuA
VQGKDNIRTIFVQREYDTKNAKAIAGEIGARRNIDRSFVGKLAKVNYGYY